MQLGFDGGLPPLPATHSIPSTAALAALLTRRYGLDVVDVRFVRPGLNDVFEVEAAQGRFILRVYRTGRRTDDDIRWEVALLAHLRRAGVPVTCAVPTTEGEPFVAAAAPEGRRQVLLLDFADGRLVRAGKAKGSKPSVAEVVEEYGALAAAVHIQADGFTDPHPRFAIDAEHLVRTPELAVRPFLAHRPADLRALAEAADRLADGIATAAPGLDWGPCHGDLTGDNAVLRGGRLTLFDFDCGGPGPRAYDVAVFGWSMGLHGADPGVLDRFRAGYRTVRELPEPDWARGPLFEAARQLWFIGMQTANSGDWGHYKADDDFLDHQLALLRALADRIG